MPHQRVICETQSHPDQIGACLEEPVLDELASERGSVVEEAEGQDDRVPCTEEHQPYNEQEQSQAYDSDIEVQEAQPTLRRSTRDRRPGQIYQPRVTVAQTGAGRGLLWKTFAAETHLINSTSTP
ncbi:unnamed protein product [Pleuronectes platessa]|uniref:Uncharacterized protein n=1 Tax=Pleuronectes platessa TaxID=8262 RepID=A0A9N7ZAA7_PLEPL|nr:unnamed protein product [Pleuronectes platessa]